jgi:WD40 repeat protein
VYRSSDLQQLAAVPARAELDFTALVFSQDGELLAVAAGAPSASLSVWHWAKGQLLASAPLEAPVGGVGFHPADAGLLVARLLPGRGGKAACAAQLWRLERQWAGHSLTPDSKMQPACGARVTCHAWAPEGLYVGCDSGEVVLLDQEGGRELASTREGAAGVAVSTTEGAACDAAPCSSSTSSGDAVAGPEGGRGITSLAINADAVVVCGGRGAGAMGASDTPPLLRWYSRGGEGRGPQMALAGELPGTAGAISVALCSQTPRNALVATRDGCALLVPELPPAAVPASGAVAPAAEALADCHGAGVAGLAQLPGTAGRVLSAGADGSLRLWDAACGGQLVGRRDCPGAALTSVAAAARLPLAAAGSAAGVLRVVSTSDSTLPLVWRGRIAQRAVVALAFAPSGRTLAAVCRGGGGARDVVARDVVAFLRVARAGQGAGAVQLLGYADCGDNVLSVAWVQQGAAGGADPSDDEDQLAVTLAGGAVMLLRPPQGPLPLAAPETAGGGGGELAPERMMRLPLEALQARVAAVPAPLACIAAGREAADCGARDTLWLVGLSAAGRQLQRFSLPADLPAAECAEQGGALQRPARALPLTASSLPHAKPGTALALSPCGGFVATAGGDGGLAICDASTLKAVGEGAAACEAVPAGEGGSEQPEPEVPRPHPLAGQTGSTAVAALSFDASGGWLASGGGDGALFLHHTPGSAGSAAAANDAAAVTVAAAEGAAAAADPAAGEGPGGATDAPDNEVEQLLPQQLAEAAREADALSGAAAREETAARVRQLQARLAVLLERNAAAPEDQRLSEEEVIINVDRLQVQLGARGLGACGPAVAAFARLGQLAVHALPNNRADPLLGITSWD